MAKNHAGDMLVHMDLDTVNAAGKDPVVMVLVTNVDRVAAMDSDAGIEGAHRPKDRLVHVEILPA